MARGSGELGRTNTKRAWRPIVAGTAAISAARWLAHHTKASGFCVAAVLMARILVMAETMSLADVKARFSEIVDRVERQQDRVVVTRNGKPAAVLISPDDLESLEETLAVMTDRSIAAQIRDSQKAVAAGEAGTELGQLRAEVGKRRARAK